jgi:hypothetical protein
MVGWGESVITQIVASKRVRASRKVGLKDGGDLVEIAFGELGLHELGELGEVDTWNVAML